MRDHSHLGDWGGLWHQSEQDSYSGIQSHSKKPAPPCHHPSYAPIEYPNQRSPFLVPITVLSQHLDAIVMRAGWLGLTFPEGQHAEAGPPSRVSSCLPRFGSLSLIYTIGHPMSEHRGAVACPFHSNSGQAVQTVPFAKSCFRASCCRHGTARGFWLRSGDRGQNEVGASPFPFVIFLWRSGTENPQNNPTISPYTESGASGAEE